MERVMATGAVVSERFEELLVDVASFYLGFSQHDRYRTDAVWLPDWYYLDRGGCCCCCLLSSAVASGGGTRYGSMSRWSQGAFEDDDGEAERERKRFWSVIHARVQTPRRILGSFASLCLTLSLCFSLPYLPFSLIRPFALARAPFLSLSSLPFPSSYSSALPQTSRRRRRLRLLLPSLSHAHSLPHSRTKKYNGEPRVEHIWRPVVDLGFITALIYYMKSRPLSAE